MAMASDPSNFYVPSQLHAYGWRAFCVEFLCGTLAVVWYLLSLAEGITLRGLTRLEKLAAPPADDFPEYGGPRNSPFYDEHSSFGRVAGSTLHSQP